MALDSWLGAVVSTRGLGVLLTGVSGESGVGASGMGSAGMMELVGPGLVFSDRVGSSCPPSSPVTEGAGKEGAGSGLLEGTG